MTERALRNAFPDKPRDEEERQQRESARDREKRASDGALGNARYTNRNEVTQGDGHVLILAYFGDLFTQFKDRQRELSKKLSGHEKSGAHAEDRGPVLKEAEAWFREVSDLLEYKILGPHLRNLKVMESDEMHNAVWKTLERSFIKEISQLRRGMTRFRIIIPRL